MSKNTNNKHEPRHTPEFIAVEREKYEKMRKRRNHVFKLLENVKTSNVHDRNMHLNNLRFYPFENETWESIDDSNELRVRATIERAEGFLFRCANKYE